MGRTPGGTGPNPGRPTLAAATLKARERDDISQQNVLRGYREVYRQALAPRPRVQQRFGRFR
jgi:hypothetical protein